MDALALAAVIGIPTALALYIIDSICRNEPAWRADVRIRAAIGACWDHPAGCRAGEPGIEANPVAPRARAELACGCSLPERLAPGVASLSGHPAG